MSMVRQADDEEKGDLEGRGEAEEEREKSRKKSRNGKLECFILVCKDESYSPEDFPILCPVSSEVRIGIVTPNSFSC